MAIPFAAEVFSISVIFGSNKGVFQIYTFLLNLDIKILPAKDDGYKILNCIKNKK